MSENDETNKKKNSSVLNQIVTAVVIALLAGGTAPWWVKEIKEFLSSTVTPDTTEDNRGDNSEDDMEAEAEARRQAEAEAVPPISDAKEAFGHFVRRVDMVAFRYAIPMNVMLPVLRRRLEFSGTSSV